MTITSLLLSATVAFAPTDAPDVEPSSQEADDAAYVGEEGQTSVYEFADDKLTGEHLSPDGSLIPWRRPTQHPSLIDLRGHFMPELVRLALDL